MKKIIAMVSFLTIGNLSAQVNSNTKLSQDTESNAFLDASQNAENYGDKIGRGLNFPHTDLSKFTLNVSVLDGVEYPNYYDGMIVYNTNKGGSTNDPSLTNQTQNLESGFYYFKNPEGKKTQSISNGQWVRLGADLSTQQSGATQLSGTEGIECNKDNRGKMNFTEVTKSNGKTTDVLGICMKNENGEYYWRYFYGGMGNTTGTGTFGSDLQ